MTKFKPRMVGGGSSSTRALTTPTTAEQRCDLTRYREFGGVRGYEENLYTAGRNRASGCWCKEKSSTVRRRVRVKIGKLRGADERTNRGQAACARSARIQHGQSQNSNGVLFAGLKGTRFHPTATSCRAWLAGAARAACYALQEQARIGHWTFARASLTSFMSGTTGIS
jgi:hypothetical protein